MDWHRDQHPQSLVEKLRVRLSCAGASLFFKEALAGELPAKFCCHGAEQPPIFFRCAEIQFQIPLPTPISAQPAGGVLRITVQLTSGDQQVGGRC